MAATNAIIVRIVAFVASIILIALTVVAAIAVHRSNTLQLPVSNLIKGVATALPVAELIGLLFISVGIVYTTPAASNARTGPGPLARRRVALGASLTLGTALVLDGFLISSSTWLQDPEALVCVLAKAWETWFRNKDADAIRGIQDRYECCGLRTVKHEAWPFPNKEHHEDACVAMYGRQVPCIQPWGNDAENTLGSFVVIGAVSLAVKVFIFLLYWRRNVFSQEAEGGVRRRQARWEDPEQRGLLQPTIQEEPEEEERADGTNGVLAVQNARSSG